MSRASWLPALLLLATACDTPRQAPEASRTPAQEEAARGVCIAAELVRTSDEEIDVIEASLPADIETSAQAQTVWRPQLLALHFANVLHDHALLRHASLAHVDSAMNHRRTPADSTRHMQTAASFAPGAAEPGSLEANVAAEYERRYARIRADEDHRCNWDM
jgi:hypothetical protein